ncbi:MAG: hypothetical protein ACOCVX_02355 [Bacteroidales bacterium]
MKTNLIILSLIISVVSIGFLSCEKEDVITNGQVTQNSDNVLKKAPPQKSRHFYDLISVAYCDWPTGNCAPFDVVVTAQADIDAFDDVFDAVFGGNENEIIQAFDDNQRTLSVYLDSNIIQGVIDGVYDVEARDHNTDPDIRLLVFIKDGDIVEVDPIDCSN